MSVLATGIAALLLAFSLHILIWKIRVPSRQTRTLVVLFFASACLASGVGHLSGVEAAYMFCFVGCVALAYVSFNTAVEATSPSLEIMLLLDCAGAGVSRQDLLAQLSDEMLVGMRLDDLVRCGMVALDQGRYRITRSGCVFVWIFIFFRRLINTGKGG